MTEQSLNPLLAYQRHSLYAIEQLQNAENHARSLYFVSDENEPKIDKKYVSSTYPAEFLLSLYSDTYWMMKAMADGRLAQGQGRIGENLLKWVESLERDSKETGDLTDHLRDLIDFCGEHGLSIPGYNLGILRNEPRSKAERGV